MLYEIVVEVKERVILDHENCQLPTKGRRVSATNGETLWVYQEMDMLHLEDQLKAILAKGIESLAVVLMHSYM